MIIFRNICAAVDIEMDRGRASSFMNVLSVCCKYLFSPVRETASMVNVRMARLMVTKTGVI